MDLSYFLYRRLARWITCRVRLPFGASLSLSTKYDVASFQDVFCHPFYWQSFGWVRGPPRLVVDCGANCGHFSILTDTCIRVRFGRSDTRYILVEPNPALRPILERNLRDAGLASRSRVVAGLLGAKAGRSTLWVHPKNYLASSLSPLQGAIPHEVPFVDLRTELPEPHVDILKVDIEGGEYAFVRENPDVFSLAQLLLMEVHPASREEQALMFGRIEATGLLRLGHAVESDGLSLHAWTRNGAHP